MSYTTMPDLFEPAIIGWIKGRPVREICGGAPDGDGDGGDGGNLDGLGDLLGGDGDGGDTGGGDSGTGEGGDGGEQPPAWWAAAEQRITQQTQSQIDRRINQLVQGRRQQQGTGNGGQQQQGGQPQPVSTGPDRADLQYARSVFRDTVADSIKLSAEEREFVNTVAPGIIRASFDRTSEPDAAGAEAATGMVAQIKKLRTAHQSQLISRLERAGALDRTKLTQGAGAGQPQQGVGGQPSAAAAMAAGADKARQMAAANGRPVPGQKTT